MEGHNVVPGRVQLSCLNQLQETANSGPACQSRTLSLKFLVRLSTQEVFTERGGVRGEVGDSGGHMGVHRLGDDLGQIIHWMPVYEVGTVGLVPGRPWPSVERLR